MDSLLKPGNPNLLDENFFPIYELHLKYKTFLCKGHCVKSVQIRNFLWSTSSRIFTNREIFIRSIQIRENPFQIQENTSQKKTRIQALFRNWEVPDRIQCWLDLRQKKKQQKWKVLIQKLIRTQAGYFPLNFCSSFQRHSI